MAIENQLLKDKIESVSNIVELGYKELQNIRNKPIDEVAIPLQIREIIMCCGQYYADYYNEHQKNLQLEQKNNFLNNRINILNNNIKAMIEELKNLKYQNDRLQNDNTLLRNIINRNANNKYSKMSKSENHLKYCKDITKFAPKNFNVYKREKVQTVDLECHLSLIRNMLNEQDNLLDELNKLTKDLNDESYTGISIILIVYFCYLTKKI